LPESLCIWRSAENSHDAVSANAVLDAAADLQRDLTRAPMQLTRLSDEEETRIGDELAAEYASADSPKTAAAHRLERYVGEVGNEWQRTPSAN